MNRILRAWSFVAVGTGGLGLLFLAEAGRELHAAEPATRLLTRLLLLPIGFATLAAIQGAFASTACACHFRSRTWGAVAGVQCLLLALGGAAVSYWRMGEGLLGVLRSALRLLCRLGL